MDDTDSIKDLIPTYCFRCKICKNMLSAPVMLVDNVGNLCYSCFQIEKSRGNIKNYQENVNLLQVLELVHLPCQNSFRGCLRRLKYTEVEAHQKECSFNMISCPIVTKSCEWIGRKIHLLQHLVTDHVDDTLEPQGTDQFIIETGIEENIDVVHILSTLDAMFLVRLEGDVAENKMYYKIYDLEDKADNYKFYVKLTHSNDPCSEDICQGTKHLEDFHSIVTYEATQLDYKVFKESLDNISSLKHIIKINKIVKVPCSVCKVEVQSELCNCNCKNVICDDCKLKSDTPSQCQEEPGEVIDDQEQLSLLAQYNCKYQPHGCKVKGTSHEIKRHEENCHYKIMDCTVM